MSSQRPPTIVLFGCIAALLTLGGVAPVLAAAEQEQPRRIEVTGRAELSANPDRARFNAAVETRADTAKKAAAANAQTADAVVKALKAQVGDSGEVRSSGYSLQPDYEWEKKGTGQTRVLRGYVASNEVSVTTSDLASVGGLLDAAVSAGANSAGQIEFFLADEAEATRAATLEAGRRARLSAETVAESLGVGLGRLMYASTGVQAQAQPKMMASRMRVADAEFASAETPMEPGTLVIRAEVEAAFEIQ